MLNKLQKVFASLEKHNVKFVVLGDVASVLYGVPRATFDVDILIEATLTNAQRLLDAFLEANLGTASLITPNKLLQNEITVFSDYVRIDVQTSTPGLLFDEAWNHRMEMTNHGQKFFVVSIDDLIASKRAAGRTVDIEYVKVLELKRKRDLK